MSNDAERDVVQRLEAMGASLRFRKSGLVHTVDLTACTEANDAVLADIRHLKRLAVLSLAGTSVTNLGLEPLAELEKLESLDLSNTAIDDQACPYFAQLGDRLKLLVITGTSVSSDSVRRLRKELLNTRIIQLD